VQPWTNFDASKEWIKNPKAESKMYAIDVSHWDVCFQSLLLLAEVLQKKK